MNIELRLIIPSTRTRQGGQRNSPPSKEDHPYQKTFTCTQPSPGAQNPSLYKVLVQSKVILGQLARYSTISSLDLS